MGYHMPKGYSRALFYAIDTDHSGHISEREFCMSKSNGSLFTHFLFRRVVDSHTLSNDIIKRFVVVVFFLLLYSK